MTGYLPIRESTSPPHDFLSLKVAAVVHGLSVRIDLRLKKCPQHGEGQGFAETPGAGEKRHHPALFQDIPDEKRFVHIIAMVIDHPFIVFVSDPNLLSLHTRIPLPVFIIVQQPRGVDKKDPLLPGLFHEWKVSGHTVTRNEGVLQ